MKTRVLLCLIAAATLACGNKTTTKVAAADATKPPAGTAAEAKGFKLPPDHPMLGVSNTQAAAAPQARDASLLSGKIVETMNAGGYTYVRLDTGRGEVWAAIPETKLTVGAPATISAQMTMPKFESKSLKRTFDELVFGTLAGPGAAAPAAAQAAGTPQAHMAAPANVPDVKVPRAEGAGAKTVAELWAAKASIKDQPVVVRGKVVKSLSGIMGKNWIHIRDGSGTASKGDNDLTVTTSENAAVGDVVIVKGVVRVDKDFGAGYLYPVIIEDAKISK